uniref:Small nuclear ribonucleoprotein Sm D3 n=1 Tax=Hyaloperonospora arabidopsidis (strain Emoy2) TaxID=559515 RepID=M4BUP9_HYAAE
MSTTSVGVPISLLHEGEGRTVTIELKNGEVYRGHLTESEDSMNCQLSNVVLTQRDGQKSKLELVYVRGSQIKLVILPELLKNSPLLSKVQALSKKNEEQKQKKSKHTKTKDGAKSQGRSGGRRAGFGGVHK